MIAEWTSYRIEDFLLFSKETYSRLFELNNATYWPLPLLATAAGLGLIALVFRRPSGTFLIVAIFLSVLWGACAWAFFWTSYATINWTATYAALAFTLQAALLLFILPAKRRPDAHPRELARWLGLTLLIFAVVIHPLLAFMTGHPLLSAEVIGLAPDPTAIATLGVLLVLSHGWRKIVLSLIPVCWLLVSALTLFGLDSWQWPVPLLAVGAFAAGQALR